MSPDPRWKAAHKAQLAKTREVLEAAGPPMSEEVFVAHIRRHAESRLWSVITAQGGPAVRLVLARRDRIVLIGTTPLARLTPTQRDLLDVFRDAGAETYTYGPEDAAAAEAVLA